MTRSRLLVAVAAAALLAGAEGGSCEDVSRVEAAVVRAGNDCGGAGAEPSAEAVTSAERWGEVFPPALGADPAAPAIDFAKAVIVVVRMGERATGGHSVELASPSVPVKDGVAALAVALRAPAPGAMVTQALTRPCLAVRLPRDGLREVKVVDAGGKVLATVAVR